jgi:hypothetical protein
MGRCAALLPLMVGACGRIAFDPLGSPDSGPTDTTDAPPPNVRTEWVVTPVANNAVIGWSVATDAQSNVYVTGDTDGDIDLGGGNLTGPDRDIYFASYDPSGAFRMGKRFGAVGSDQGRGIAVGPGGSVYIGGWFSSTVDFGGQMLTCAGSEDVVVASYTQTGTLNWAHGYGGADLDRAYDIAAGPGDAVAIAGGGNTVDFGGGAVGASTGCGTVSGEHHCDGVFAGFAGTGAYGWSTGFGAAGVDDATGVSIDDSGNTYGAGYFSASIDLGNGAQPTAGSYDTVLASYGPTGAFRWGRAYGGPSDDFGDATAAGAGEVAFVGTFGDSVDFGSGVLSSGAACQSSDSNVGCDGFVAVYDIDGVPRWSHAISTAGLDEIDGVAIDAAGNVYITGYITGDLDLGGAHYPSTGGLDILVASFAPDGTVRWAKRFGGTGSDDGIGIAVAPDGAVYVTGVITAPVDFGTGVVSATTTTMFLLKLTPT